MRIRPYALATTALTGLFLPQIASAQSAGGPVQATAGTSEDETPVGSDKDSGRAIVVKGIRKSIQKSLDIKRNSSAQIDVITAEDVAKFPDTNVAESLSRLPGVQVDHSDGGEGNKVSILGIDSRLINVQLDGNNLATSSVGVADPDSGRSFNFTNLAPEIIGTVEVYKSTEARLDEGAVGGTIIVNTRNPLDLKPNTVSISGNYNYNLRTKSGDPRASLFYSWHNKGNTLGFIGLVAYNKLQLGSTSIGVLSGYETACNVPGWGGCTNGAFANPSLLPTVSSGPALTPTTLVPRNLNSGSFIQTEKRLTLHGKVQWRPTDNFEASLSGYAVNGDDSSYSQAMLSDLGVNWDDRNGYSAVDPVTGATNYPITYSSVTTNSTGVTGGTMTNVAERLDLQYNHQTLNTRALNLKARWTPDTWNIELNAGRTTATGGVSPQYYLSFYGHTSAVWALTENSSSLVTGTPLTDPTLFQSRATGQQAGFVKTAVTNDKINYAKIDIRKDVNLFDFINKIEVGFKYQKHSNSDYSHFYNTNVKQVGDLSAFNYLTTSPSLVSGLGASGDLLSYAYLSQQDMIDYSIANRNPGFSAGSPTHDYNNTGAEWNTEETDGAGYFQADFRHGRFHGNAGVRFVSTDNKQTYFSSQDYYPWIQDFVHTKKKYSDVLPAANLVYDLTDNQLLRFTVAKVMSRPSFADQSGQVTYNIQTRTGGGGNPNLGPYRATNWGASYEYYFAPHSLFSVDAFYRNVNQYTIYKNVLTSIIVPQATLDYCNTPVPATNGGIPACPGLTNPVQILMNTPYNGSHAQVKGLSVSFQGDLKWGFGIQTNVTYLTQKYGSFTAGQTVTGNQNGTPVTTNLANTAGKYPLPFLSKWSYTIAPYFERGPVEAHVSYTWRSKYSQVAGDETSQPTYTASFGQLDASLTYHLGKRFEINASAVNILDPLVKPFTTGNLPLGWSKYGRRVSAGATLRFN